MTLSPDLEKSRNQTAQKLGIVHSIWLQSTQCYPETMVRNSKALKSNDSNSSSQQSSTSPSSVTSATPEGGFAKTNENICSPLIHPISILMISFLNDTFPKLPDDFWSMLNDADTVKESLTYKSCDVRDGIFASAVKHCDTSDSEVELTQQIVVNIKLRIERMSFMDISM